MELLAPAGSPEKIYYAYVYGADAAYIGLKNFSLRSRADNFQDDDYRSLQALKGEKKLYCALNIFFQPEDLKRLEESVEDIQKYPFDAFIVSDIGVLPILKKHFPGVALHLSTQANCVNSEAAKIYRDLGFKRLILGRELSLSEIQSIKREVPEVELEVFGHGAMCLAYSGRCFLSAHMAERSGNRGDCAHSCRWDYRVLEESERPGEYYPIVEGDNFTTLLSSRDICMIDHIGELKDAGVDSLKIEGRMKSIYYTAIVTRAYRKMIDSVVRGEMVPDLADYREELFHISHREYSTGFFFGREDIEKPTELSYQRSHLLLGSIGKKIGDNLYRLSVKNSIYRHSPIEYIGPHFVSRKDDNFLLFSEEGEEAEAAHHSGSWLIKTEVPLEEGYIIRRKIDAVPAGPQQ